MVKLPLSLWLVDQQDHPDLVVRRVARDFARGRCRCEDWQVATAHVRTAYRAYLDG